MFGALDSSPNFTIEIVTLRGNNYIGEEKEKEN